MKTSEYLYGVGSEHWWNLPYGEAIVERIERAEELLSLLYEEDFMNRDEPRANSVKLAITHNKRLLKERVSITH